VVTKRRRKK